MTDYERGRAAGLAEAVKVIEPEGPVPNCCDECARRWYVLKERADALRALSTSPGEPQWTYGHCKEKAKPGGCQLHNLHCGYPDCDRRAMLSEKE